MRILEFGQKENKNIILIHGLNIPWQMWNREIEYYKQNYNVIVPVLDGHDTESNDKFVSVQEEAKKIKEYYIKNHGTEVYMMIGMSMGSAIAFSILSDGEMHAENLVLDSGVFVPSGFIIRIINNRSQLGIKNKTKMRDKKTLAQLDVIYGKDLAQDYIKMADKMKDDDLLTASNSIGRYRLIQKTDLSDTKIISFHGTDFMEIMAKRSAKYLKKHFPQAYIKVFEGYHHGELSVNRPDEFTEEIKKAL